jgi:tetratricopeptide (TPR) repeat protein
VVELYEKAIVADPSFAAAYYNLANACRDLRQAGRALDNYELALMADPKFADARRNYAILLQQQGYIADALDQYDNILQDNPEDAAVHVTVAGLYAANRSTLAKARSHYEAYLKLIPNAPHAAEIRRWLDQNR